MTETSYDVKLIFQSAVILNWNAPFLSFCQHYEDVDILLNKVY